MKYGWHTQPLAVMILLFLAELAVFFWMYENLSLKEKKRRMDRLAYLWRHLWF